VLTDEPVVVDGVAGLVLACGSQPVSDLLSQLDEGGIPYVAAGDCLAPRTVEEAVLEGLVAAVGI
jgi:hypothetical protein